MISFDFEYYRPTSVEEAVNLYIDLDNKNKQPVYYSGGTEIICMARLNKINTGAVIDIKEIQGCRDIKINDDKIEIGAAATLTEICEQDVFPMLSKVLKNLADHTSRCKITIGGNICGKIPYRESVLPLMLCESTLEINGPSGLRAVNINDVFNKTLKLNKDEFLSRIITDREYALMPFMCIKKTKNERVDYPLISIAAIKKKNKIRAGFSGVCSYPFMQDKINMKKLERSFPEQIISDNLGSKEYRSFVLNNALKDIIEGLEV